MNFNFQALEEAFAVVGQIGNGEKTFEVAGQVITLRVILPSEEIEVQRYANALLEEKERDQQTALEYLDRITIGTLSHAIVRFGQANLANVEYVETGDTLDNGKPVKVRRIDAVRKLLGKWSRPVLLNVFKKYAELLIEVERKADGAIEFDPSDFDTEIERLQERILDLQKRKEELTTKDIFSDQVQRVANMDLTEAPVAETSQEEPAPQTPPPPPVQQTPQPEPVPQPQVRRSAVPQAVPPPITAPQARPQQQQQQQQRPLTGAQIAAGYDLQDEGDSFLDPADLEATVQAENQRLLRARLQTGAPISSPTESVLSQAHMGRVRRRPPHLDAAQVEQQPPMETAEPVFRQEVEEISAHSSRGGGVGRSVNVNQPAGNVNPRFRPVKP